MVRQVIHIVVVAALLLAGIDYANRMLNDSEVVHSSTVRFYPGGGTEAPPAKEESGWSDELPAQPGAGWVRAVFTLPAHLVQMEVLELRVEFLGAYELYWEGVLLERNGVASSDPGLEKAGYIDRMILLPDSLLAPGEQVLTLRYSDHENTRRASLHGFGIEPYGEFATRSMFQFLLIGGLAGIFLVVALYYGFMYVNSFSNRYYLLFALLCGTSFLLILLAYSRYLYPYTYDAYTLHRYGVELLSFFVTLLLPLFYLHYFKHPRQRLLGLAVPAVLLAARMLPGPLPGIYNLVYTGLAIAFPFYFVIWALFKRRRGVTEAAVGLIVFVASFMYYDATVYFGFGILIIATLLALSRTLGRERRRHEQARLKSSRLEVEMLKRNIQPHFLMNTLTNIISLIESQPELSVRLIESLSDEFYAMLEISDKKSILVSKEIELCRAHLEVMSIRDDVTYDMEVYGEVEEEEIPPAVIHTIIENGMKHNEPVDGGMKFRIDFDTRDGERRFRIWAFGSIPSDSRHKKIGQGTGFKYIRARLEENYPGRWELDSFPDDGGWCTTIIIKDSP